MKQDINFYGFEEAFRNHNRYDNFEYDGLKALYDYLTEMEESCDMEIELDVIALCCEYTRYEDIQEYINDYDPDIDPKDYDDREEYEEAVKEHIQDNTQFIDIDGEAFIMGCY